MNNKFQFINLDKSDNLTENDNSNEIIKENDEQIIDIPISDKEEPILEVSIPEENPFQENQPIFDNKEDKEIKNDTDNNFLNNKKTLKRKIHISFEARLLSMLFLIFILFLGACYFILKTINYGNDESIAYNENTNIYYEVCLNNEQECLDEGLEYDRNNINKIDTSFDYNVEYSTNVESNMSYYITAKTRVFDRNRLDEVLFQEEETLINNDNYTNIGKKVNINETIEIDYNKYITKITPYLVKNVTESYGEIQISLFLKEGDDSREVSSLVIPLTGNSFHISKNVISNENQIIEVPSNEWNDSNINYAVIASILIVFCLIIVYRCARLVILVTTTRNSYQKTLQNILSEYDRLIVIARDGYESNEDKKIIKLNSFEELLKTREIIQKPIIYSRVNNIKSDFIVEDNEKLYKYTLKERN